ncbi:VOC family protein [Novosphingobium malaysiense]|uniref:VOC domain-containing protein n=1 Tax=Novosphingobium malaysiense TaxID=1348853 RepID=A0A0B1ZDK6_9SPHN|nr:VOC family protein [Novosphingobium malaysiense]KHK89094.1 hypothetical protein LK12_22440 [Novosphingobium malaysiense]
MAVPQLRNVFQICYATNDIDRAAVILQEQFGCGEMLFMRDLPDSLTQIALSYCGDTNFELVQPHNPSGDFYSDWISGAQDFVLRLHHYGMLVDSREDMAAIRAAHVARGHGIPLEASMPGNLDALYADVTGTLGHYLEYIYLEEGGRQMFAAVPGSPMR